MPYGLTEEGEPTFLISSMAMHTRNLQSDPRATLLVIQQPTDGNPLGAGRVSLMGEATPIDEASRDCVAKGYLQRHPDAQNWMNYGDFQFFQLRLIDVYFVGGFGVMGWISAADYRQARPDPLADLSDSIIAHMNEDHRPAMVLLAERFSLIHAQDAIMTSVDRLGFHLRLQTESGFKGTRIKFPTPIDDAEDVRRVMVALVASARQQT
jgi:putative heme iron utilization protein